MGVVVVQNLLIFFCTTSMIISCKRANRVKEKKTKMGHKRATTETLKLRESKDNTKGKQAPTAKASIPGRQGYHGCVPNYSGHLPRYPVTLCEFLSRLLNSISLVGTLATDENSFSASTKPSSVSHL